jgi:hypothetical protein
VGKAESQTQLQRDAERLQFFRFLATYYIVLLFDHKGASTNFFETYIKLYQSTRRHITETSIYINYIFHLESRYKSYMHIKPQIKVFSAF